MNAPIQLYPDADMTLAYNQVVDRLERLKLELPAEAQDRVGVWKWNSDDWSILWMGVALDSSITDPYRFLETHVRRRLERVDGVAKVDFWGVDEKEVIIEIDQDRMDARGVDIGRMVQALRSDNFSLAGGYVREGGKQFFVRSLAKYRSMYEIENVKVDSRNGGVRLNEIADIHYDVPLRSWFQRIDGMPAVSAEMFQESGANVSSVCDRVVAELRAIETDPKMEGSISFNVFANQGEFIEQSIRNLQATGIWGGFFAALVLLFFLRTLRYS